MTLYFARLCRFFRCTPSALSREFEFWPDGFLDEIVEAHVVEECWTRIERHGQERDEDTPMMTKVKAILETRLETRDDDG